MSSRMTLWTAGLGLVLLAAVWAWADSEPATNCQLSVPWYVDTAGAAQRLPANDLKITSIIYLHNNLSEDMPAAIEYYTQDGVFIGPAWPDNYFLVPARATIAFRPVADDPDSVAGGQEAPVGQAVPNRPMGTAGGNDNKANGSIVIRWQGDTGDLQGTVEKWRKLNENAVYSKAILLPPGTLSDYIPHQTETIMLPGDVPLELVWVPSGSFQMGRYPGEADSYDCEDPQHPVTLAYGFWMGKYEVTQEQWLAVRGSWPGTAPSSTYGLGDSYPAYFISWNDAKDFITSLNAHISSSGQGPLTVRLPSEAEWEYACRAGTQTRFYWGDDIGYTQIGTYAWYSDNNSPYGSKPVGGKTANTFGLYDMSGNVHEWCEDDYHGSYTGAPVDGSAWIDSPRASYRMFRGGFWHNHARRCRSAFRDYDAPGLRDGSLGFRLAAVQ